MVFSSILFLFLYLPFTLTLYFLTGKRYKNLLLLIASLIFYAWGEGLYLFIMLISILINYSCGLLIDNHRGSNRSRVYLSVAIILNLGILAFFKYANFAVSNLNSFFSVFGIGPLFLPPVHLPIGISFFTFQAISYVIDVYKQKAPVQRNIINLGVYIALFPQLIAGPIVRFSHIAKEIVVRAASRQDFAEGVRRFLFGLAKKMLIANSMALVADKIFSFPTSELTTSLAWFGAVCYTLQIYFDFSGYSDMAIGLGRMFGFHFLENFNYPYISCSIQDFWRRWHISLSTWFRDYLYIPLGGNRLGPGRTYLNLVIVFFLCGLWHGASWNFVIWGLFHGLFLVAERSVLGHVLKVLPSLFGHLYTLLVVIIAWVIFRSESISSAGGYIAAMFGFASGSGVKYNLAMFLTSKLTLEICLGIILSIPVYPLIKRMEVSVLEICSAKLSTTLHAAFNLVGLVLLIVFTYASIITLAASVYNPFIYFRF